MSSFVEPYFDDIFCGIYYRCEVKKKSLRTTFIFSCLPPEKAIKINPFPLLPLEQPYPPQKGRTLEVDPDFNKSFHSNYLLFSVQMHIQQYNSFPDPVLLSLIITCK